MLRIGIAFSLKPDDGAQRPDGPDDLYEEFDKPETIEALAEAIRADGHDVSLLGDDREFLQKMLDAPPDFVFNFAEGQGVGRSREARVPAVCEMLGVPYSGSDPFTLSVTLDKHAAKVLVRDSVSVPDGVFVSPSMNSNELNRTIEWFFSKTGGSHVIVKPAFEGSSKGIRGTILGESVQETLEICRRTFQDYRQPIVVEEFIDGEEVTVGVLGNGTTVDILGLMKISPIAQTPSFVYSLEMKRDWRNCIRYESPANVQELEPGLISLAAKNAYALLGCRDVARIDFRLNHGVPYFIEANPLPGLAPGTSDLVILAEGYGISHGDLVRKILRAALQRVGLDETRKP